MGRYRAYYCSYNNTTPYTDICIRATCHNLDLLYFGFFPFGKHNSTHKYVISEFRPERAAAAAAAAGKEVLKERRNEREISTTKHMPW